MGLRETAFYRRPTISAAPLAAWIGQVYPPPEIVAQGCGKVQAWCARRLKDRIARRQHAIVMAVQDALKQVQ